MTTFQLDENNSSKALIRRCKKAGLAEVKGFAKKHRNKALKDPQMLPIYLALGHVLVTWDRHMVEDHESDVPASNPGIVIVRHADYVPYTLTQGSAEKIIEKFKLAVPNWHSIPWQNSIVKINNDGVEVGRKIGDSIVYDLYVEMNKSGCAGTVQDRLIANSSTTENSQ